MKILVAIDGSAASKAAVRFAGEFASNCRTAELVLLMVNEPTPESSGVFPRAAALMTLRRMQKGLRASKILATAGRDLHPRKVRVRGRHVVPRKGESVAQTILREAREERAHLIVAGNSGTGAVQSFVLGSVAQRLISAAQRPVTLVPAARRRSTGRSGLRDA
jgi:nucleotide-binding universal stress UspA family protein